MYGRRVDDIRVLVRCRPGWGIASSVLPIERVEMERNQKCERMYKGRCKKLPLLSLLKNEIVVNATVVSGERGKNCAAALDLEIQEPLTVLPFFRWSPP